MVISLWTHLVSCLASYPGYEASKLLYAHHCKNQLTDSSKRHTMKFTPSIWIMEGCVLKVKLCYQCMKTFSVNRYRRRWLLSAYFIEGFYPSRVRRMRLINELNEEREH